jgi:hypothetical protein
MSAQDSASQYHSLSLSSVEVSRSHLQIDLMPLFHGISDVLNFVIVQDIIGFSAGICSVIWSCKLGPLVGVLFSHSKHGLRLFNTF